MDDFPFLSKIESPADLRALDRENLPAVADELREFLIQGVARCGGHFGASLGAVELTVALHYAFNTPEDWLVWDVGHQSYGHKILTGRRDQLETIRRWGAWHRSRNGMKALTTALEWGTPAPRSARPWAWRWPAAMRGNRASRWP